MNSSSTVRDYVCKLSDSDLKFICDKFETKLSESLADIINFASKSKPMDKLFMQTSDANDVYDIVDHLYDVAKTEFYKRIN